MGRVGGNDNGGVKVANRNCFCVLHPSIWQLSFPNLRRFNWTVTPPASTAVDKDLGEANHGTNLSFQCDWSPDGHVTQAGPMRILL